MNEKKTRKSKKKIMWQKEIEEKIYRHIMAEKSNIRLCHFSCMFSSCVSYKRNDIAYRLFDTEKKDLWSAHASNETFLMKFKSIFFNELSIALKLCNFPLRFFFLSSLPFVYVCRYRYRGRKNDDFLIDWIRTRMNSIQYPIRIPFSLSRSIYFL